jgi:hypothetical protein
MKLKERNSINHIKQWNIGKQFNLFENNVGKNNDQHPPPLWLASTIGGGGGGGGNILKI